MEKITQLTKEQTARFPEFVEKWTKIGLSTERADRGRAEVALKGLYELAKLAAPQIYWLECPISGMCASTAYAAILNHHDEALKKLVSSAPSRKRSPRNIVGEIVDSNVRWDQVPAEMRTELEAATKTAPAVARIGNLAATPKKVQWEVLNTQDLTDRVKQAMFIAVREAAIPIVSGALGQSYSKDLVTRILHDVARETTAALFAYLNPDVSSLPKADGFIEGFYGILATTPKKPNSEIGGAIRSAARAFWAGSLWAGYAAWADYFNVVLEIPIDRNYLDAVSSCGYCWLLEGVVFATERPTMIYRDTERRLHSEHTQSIGYPTGWGLWHIHGVRVPQHVVEDPTLITKDEIDKESNAEVRRVMLDRYGWSRYLCDSKAEIVNEDAAGKLWRLPIENDEPLVMIEVVNNSAEPDGTFKRYFIRVPPDTKTALEGKAWTHWKKPENYNPQYET